MDWIENDGREVVVKSPSFSLCAEKDFLRGGLRLSHHEKNLGELFSLEHDSLDEIPESSYVRGCDLVGFFQVDDFDSEVYWRIVSTDDSFSIEAIFSIRARELTHSELELKSNLRFADTTSYVTNEDRLCMSGNGFSGVLLCSSADRDAIQLNPEKNGVSCSIALTNMERGVIRRLRLRLALSENTFSNEQLQQLWNDFHHSPIPLTT